MPDEFLLGFTSFNKSSQPFLAIIHDQQFEKIELFGLDLALKFDLSTRYCIGWRDSETRQNMVCPEEATVEDKYEECIKCRQRTGFNPAFYYADKISEAQQAINAQEHFVYLAYFAPGIVKVGISQEARVLGRILEQGARYALKLETFSSANVARQYEAKLSSLDGVVEHLPNRKKMQLLKEPFDEAAAKKELETVLEKAKSEINVTFDAPQPIQTSKYFHSEVLDTTKAIDMSGQDTLVGEVVAMIGNICLTDYQGNLLAYNLKQFVGRKAKTLKGKIDITLPIEQLTLF